MVGARIDPIVEGSKILVTIKKSGGVVCGIYKNSTAPLANFSTISKVWNGNTANPQMNSQNHIMLTVYTVNNFHSKKCEICAAINF